MTSTLSANSHNSYVEGETLTYLYITWDKIVVRGANALMWILWDWWTVTCLISLFEPLFLVDLSVYNFLGIINRLYCFVFCFLFLHCTLSQVMPSWLPNWFGFVVPNFKTLIKRIYEKKKKPWKTHMYKNLEHFYKYPILLLRNISSIIFDFVACVLYKLFLSSEKTIWNAQFPWESTY